MIRYLGKSLQTSDKLVLLSHLREKRERYDILVEQPLKDFSLFQFVSRKLKVSNFSNFEFVTQLDRF